MFDSLGGLPLHPLVVHAAVVLLPLGTLGVVLCAFIPALARRFAGLSVLGLAAGTASALVAEQSGAALAARVGAPGVHGQWGGLLPKVAIAAFIVAAVWWFLQRRDRATTPARVGGIAAAILSLAALGLTVVTGHSGATAVWGETLNPPPAAPAPVATPPAAGNGSPSPSAGSASPAASFTLTQVAEHNTAADCWTAVDGGVYDLTEWVAKHPGGESPIGNLCGSDATEAFRGKHGSQENPNNALARFRIGDLA